MGNRRGIDDEANIGGRGDEKTARRADAEHKEIEPARDFGRIFNRLGAVECGDGFRKNRVEKICAAEAANPDAFGAIEIRAHQIGAAKLRAEQIRIVQIGLDEIGAAQIGHRQVCTGEIGSLQLSTLKIDTGQIGFGKIHAAEISFVTGLAGAFDPDAVLVEDFGEFQNGNRGERVFGRLFRSFVDRPIVVLQSFGRHFGFRMRFDFNQDFA